MCSLNKYIIFLLFLTLIIIFFACDRYAFLSEDEWQSLFGEESVGGGSVSSGSSSSTYVSNNANLSDLWMTSGNISPYFSRNIINYNCNVNVAKVYVTAVKEDTGASLSVSVNSGSYMTLNSGISSNALTLIAGDINDIEIRVIAEDSTIKKYMITVPHISYFLDFVETFDHVPDGQEIHNDQTNLDNPDSFINFSGKIIAGTDVSGNGAIEMGAQRMYFVIPYLGTLSNPLLRVTIKNDDSSGNLVTGLSLAVGNIYSTTGKIGESGYLAHGKYTIESTDYQVIEIPLNTAFTSTGGIQFRPVVGSTQTAGLFIEKIEIIENFLLT